MIPRLACLPAVLVAAQPAVFTQHGPVLEYRMDEGEGAVVRDSAGARDGEVAEPVWVQSQRRAALRFEAGRPA